MPEYTRRTEEKDINWFLDTVVVGDIGSVIDAGCGYLAFALIAQSIEMLGALLDEQEIGHYEQGLPAKRFAKGITEVFKPIDARYAEFNKEDSEYYLWENLRCGMAHIIRPKSKIVFTGKSDANKLHASHLDKIKFDDGEKYLLLVVEDFYDHLKDACRRTKNKLTKKTHVKLKKGYITIHHVQEASSFSHLSGGTAASPTLSGSGFDIPVTGVAPGTKQG
jgi:hypothetical protein